MRVAMSAARWLVRLLLPKGWLLLVLLLPVPTVLGDHMYHLSSGNNNISLIPGLQPARLSCNAEYSAPCARTNSEWLARSTAITLIQRIHNNETTLEAAFQEITDQKHNMRRSFYPFVFHKGNEICMAHGAVPEFVGLSLLAMFEIVGIAFSDPVALMKRFITAAESGGGWVRYIWSNGSEGHSKVTYVTSLTDDYLIGVGYENKPLPYDVPCSADYDSWCSLTNVRSLLGKAQLQISMAESLPQFEAAVYDLSFDSDYRIPGGFYVFMYSYEGRLKSHAIIHDYLGSTFAEVIVDKSLGTTEEAWELHNHFVTAAEGANNGWVRYPWKNRDDKLFTKVALIIKIDFQGKWYYLGCGFDFNTLVATNSPAMMTTPPEQMDSEAMRSASQSMMGSSSSSQSTTMGASGMTMGSSSSAEQMMFPRNQCSQNYNLPCSFRTALQLSSHALVHAISSPTSDNETFRAITEDPNFRSSDFYVFVNELDTGISRAHGLVPSYVGMTIVDIFAQNRIAVNASAVHENFRQAALQGGGWVLYDWVVPGVEDSLFQKVSYIFQINLDGKNYYGGVGFNHQRAPLQEFKETGTTMNGDRIPCSREYGLACSDNNVRALLGQASAELTLAGSDARVTIDREQQITRQVDDILKSINDKHPAFTVNDFFVSVFHTHSFICKDDESGCCVAHGSNQNLVGKTWQEILDDDNITSISGKHLHSKLLETCNSDYGSFDYLYSKPTGEARTKRAVVASFSGVMDDELYVVAEYFLTPPPPTCDNCPKGMECTEKGQSYCERKGKNTSHSPVPWIVSFTLLIVCSAIVFYWYERRNWKKREILAKRIKQMEEQMQGMVEIILDTGTQITSAQDYKDKFGLFGVGKKPSAAKKQVNKLVWSWKENTAFLPRHNPSSIITGTSFVKYQESISDQIEAGYQEWKSGRGYKEIRVDLTDKVRKIQNQASGAMYVLDFEEMTQRNLWSEHVREIRRQEIVVEALESGVVDSLPRLPRGIDFFGANGEDFLPTFEGQVIQVSKEHSDRQWLYGSVLYDPLLADAHNLATEGLNKILSVALHDRPTSGWFPAAVSRPADVNVMKNLLNSLGGDGVSNLKAPVTWDANKEGLVPVAKNTEEYRAVEANFLAALYDQVEYVTVVGVERIQCMPLWQSYAVKKETMKLRDAKCPENRVNNQDPSVERKWLFHGTTPSVIPKIVKQGFNRAFAGRNAVAFGKGVYFARDASYSSHRAYSSPDSDGTQHIFMCRVAVGDWCQGSNGQLTPDPKPRNPLELFDSTVDNVLDPSIFVVYHDAQAYPDYLVSFQRND